MLGRILLCDIVQFLLLVNVDQYVSVYRIEQT
jgi:hypothetical protein